MNVDETVLHDLVNLEVRRQLIDGLNDLIETAIEKAFIYATLLRIHSVHFCNKTTLIGLVHVSISQMIKSGRVRIYS